MIIEDGYNTSYIDSLLVALFYKPSSIENILNQQPENNDFCFLQDMIRYNFIDLLRRRYSISSEILNEIRNYSIICGWKQRENIIDLFDISEFYTFLLDGIGCGNLLFEFLDKTPHNKFNKNLSMRSLFAREMIDQANNVDNRITRGYHFGEIPFVIPIFINRRNKNTLNTTKIDIMKKIKFNTNDDQYQKNMSWNIHSIVCYSEINPHYYTLFQLNDGEWYLYDSTLQPSLHKIESMTKNDFVNKIQQECVFIFYRLYDGF